jgi:hypothetical protein
MAGFSPAIHVFFFGNLEKTWMPATSGSTFPASLNIGITTERTGGMGSA